MNDSFENTAYIFGKYAEKYLEKYRDPGTASPYLDRLIEALPHDASVLDIGCGPGINGIYLKSRSPEIRYTGIDLAPGMISLAKSNIPDGDFRVLNCRDISLLKTNYKGVVMSFCTPYLSPAVFEETVTSLSELMEREALLYLSFIEDDPSRSGFEKRSSDDSEGLYVHYYRREDILALMTRAGFRLLAYENHPLENPYHSTSLEAHSLYVRNK
ncbi:class I SAM-dependent DNA methyltransferase [Robertkochia aurantiaca]|uniref:class I SAM-dependent DNA methyltransferase n=1 Tax=Robertkochia aurantiaca TaxID=2873700 RepID=UPI001CCFA24B|nr:class I SAM-dependent methyltransferase [Robertkochia sp. 3YJGBD-33]